MFKTVIKFIADNGSWLSIAINTFIVFINQYFLQKQKNALDKKMEKYKHQLQAEYLKTEIKTKQLFIIYPEIFAKIAWARGELLKIYGSIKRQRPIEKRDMDVAWETCNEGRNYFNVNLLFISQEVEQLAGAVFVSMAKFSRPMDEEEKQQVFNAIEAKCKLLEDQMKKELANETK